MKKTFNILFVCRHNRFRSKFAESYFKKINKNPNIEVKSAGIFPGIPILPKIGKKISKEMGILLKGKPQPVTTELFKWNDIIILITDDIKNPDNLFNYAGYKNKVINWKIKDTKSNTEAEVKRIIKEIIKKVDKLNGELNKKWKQ